MRNPLTRAVAELICATRFTSLPALVVSQAGRGLVDTVGCMLGGQSTPIAQSVHRMLERQGALGSGSLVIGTRRRAVPAFAALANAFAANALDYDDTYEPGSNPVGHPGSTTIGAALAVAEAVGAGGADLLTAIAVGYEVAIRVSLAVQPSQERRDKVWGLGVHQVFGAVAAAASLLRLDLETTVQALGLAGVHASLPSAWTASGWVKDAVAWPAMTGVNAAYLAEAGYVGPGRIFDGRRSYYASTGSDRYRSELLVDGLGERWRLLELSFKPYPACRWTHPAADLLSQIVAANQITPDAVKTVTVAGFWELEKMFRRYEPEHLVDGQFSLPYICALILAGHTPGPDWFRPDRLTDPGLLALARRVAVETDAESERIRQSEPDRLRTIVRVELTDGRLIEAGTETARGGPGAPLTDAQLTAKFLTLSEPVVGGAAANAALRCMNQLESQRDLAALLSHLQPSGAC